MNRIAVERHYWDNAVLNTPRENLRSEWICDANVSDDACMNVLLDFAPSPKEWDVTKEMHTIVEVGSGIGRLTERMADFYTNAPIIGMDISKEMTAVAQAESTHSNCHYYTGNGREILVGTGKADFVYSMLVFQHLSSMGVISYINEAGRVLRTGGTFLFQFIIGSEREPFSRHYKQKFIFDSLLNAGFTQTKTYHGLIDKNWTWVKAVKK